MVRRRRSGCGACFLPVRRLLPSQGARVRVIKANPPSLSMYNNAYTSVAPEVHRVCVGCDRKNTPWRRQGRQHIKAM